MDLSYSNSDSRFEYKGHRALTLESARTILAKTKEGIKTL